MSLRVALRALLSLRRTKLVAAATPAAALALGLNPLTDHVGYGACLVLALLGSLSAAALGAGLPVALRARGDRVSPGALVAAVSLAGVVPVVVALSLLLVRALVVPPCAAGHGALTALLVALPGPLLASLLGASLGASLQRRGAATAIALALVPTFVVWSLARFYSSPTIFAYDPFYGFFPGAIYDEDVPLGATLLSYRAGTAGWILAALSLLHAGWEGAALSRTAWRSRGRWCVTMALGVVAGLGVFVAGPALGHRHSARDLEEALGASAWSARCVVRYDRSIPPRQAQLTAADCDVRVAQLEDFYGVRAPRRITVFLFADAAQKQALMGAAHTYIAKPWRAEVYLQHAPFPHPVLKHELAHAVAGAMAPGPFQVTVRGRLLPVPGLIEGAAVAAAWEGDGDATPHEWSRAMLEAGITPRVASLNSLSFFASGSSTAYTAAGSFCRWLHDAHGAARFRAVYASGAFSAVYGRDLAALERAWHAYLRTVPVDAAVVARARARFFRGSIFGRRCPFDLEALERRAVEDLAASSLVAAEQGFRSLLRQDPSSLRARVALAVTLARRGDDASARGLVDETARVAGPAAAQRVRTALADALWRWGDPASARRAMEALDPRLMGDDEARTHALKRAALAQGGAFARVLQTLLVGERELDPSPAAALALAARAELQSPDLRYLVARQLVQHERFADAVALLGGEGLRDARVRAEALRLRGVALFHLRRWEESVTAFAALRDDPTRPTGTRDDAADWVDRIRRTRGVP
jgi:hypothetical protein